MAEMNKLKPCPFCGGEAVHLRSNLVYTTTYVSCTKCSARTDYYNTKGWATRAWNRRVSE